MAFDIFVNVPLGIIAILLSTVLIKESFDITANKKIEYTGMAILSIAMFSITYTLIWSSDFGWISAKMFGLPKVIKG